MEIIKCPIHEDCEMEPFERTMNPPEVTSCVLRENVYHNPEGFGNVIHSCVAEQYKEKDKIKYKCPYGCEFETEVQNTCIVGERWVKR